MSKQLIQGFWRDYYELGKDSKSSLLTSTGLYNHFKTVYGNSVVLQGDDVESYNHFRHAHLCLSGEINRDAEIKLGERLLRQLKQAVFLPELI